MCRRSPRGPQQALSAISRGHVLDLNTRIRAELDQGRTIDEIVADLVAKGMTEPNARRIVERASTLPPLPPPDVQPPSTRPPDAGITTMVIGAFFAAIGAVLVALTAAVSLPDGKFLVAYGSLFGGLVALARGFRQWDPARHPFPITGVAVALIVPAMAGGVLYEVRKPPSEEERARLAEIEQARIDREQARAAERLQDRELGRRLQGEIPNVQQQIVDAVNARFLLMSARASDRCEGARFFGDYKLADAAPDLERMFENDPDLDVRRCAFNALVDVGMSTKALHATERLSSQPKHQTLVRYAYERLAGDPNPFTASQAQAALRRIKGY